MESKSSDPIIAQIGPSDDSRFPDVDKNKNKSENIDNANGLNAWEGVEMPRVQIAAIDNGLAFPFKHPDQWRSYPYGWTQIPMAQNNFSEMTIGKILPLLTNTDFVLELGKELRKVFETDRGFDKSTFNKQLSVMYGQIYNLIEALRSRKSPFQLVQMPSIYMTEIKKGKKKRRKKAKTGKRSDEEGDDNITSSREEVITANTTELDEVGAPSFPSTSPPGTSPPGIQNGGVASTSGGPSGASIESAFCTIPTSSFETGPKSWHNTFEQKVQTRSAFFSMW